MLKFLKILLAGAVIIFLFYNVDLPQLWQALGNLTLPVALYLILLTVAVITISALKWKFFLESFGTIVSLGHLIKLYVLAYFVNLIMPSYLGGDLVRSWYVGKQVGQHAALSSTILERYTGILAMLSLALCFMWFVDLVTFEMKLTVILLFLALATGTCLALSSSILKWFSRFKIFSPIQKHLQKIQNCFLLVKKNPSLLTKTLALSFLFHSITVLNTMAAGYAVGWWDPPVGDLFVVLPLILIIGALPIAPSGLGIQEGAFFFFLVGIGATPEQALGIGIVLRIKQYLVALIGGIFWLQMKAEDPTRIIHE